MAGVFQKAMVWLGLAPDDEYDDYSYDPPPRPAAPQSRQAPARSAPRPQGRPAPPPTMDYEEDPYAARPTGRPSGAVRQLPARGALQNDPRSQRADDVPTVRPMRPTSAKPAVLTPESFDDAKDIADRFKAEQPVVMDLSGLDRDLSRRLIDFASGICYALGGHMERVAPGNYLLIPSNVTVSEEERRRLGSPR